MKPRYVFLLIIVSQFAGTSLWFAGNAILPDLISETGLKLSDLGSITSAVQAGFIIGTLIFAVTAVSDRISPSKIFFTCSILGAVFNVSIYFLPQELLSVIVSRFLTGLMLAGIYPVGMKIAADWYKDDLGKAIGYLVGALVLGTAFPNLIRAFGATLDWSTVLISVSLLASFGGILVLLFVPDGPHRHAMVKFDLKAITFLFKPGGFRSAAFGYFGHQWELYTFWAFTPIMLARYNFIHTNDIQIPLYTFLIIASGALGCVAGGIWSRKIGSASVAWVNLMISGTCILLFPIFIQLPLLFFLPYMMIWGWAVVGDSAQFSALAATNAPKQMIGSGLTIMNSLGFAVTIVSIYVLSFVMNYIAIEYAILVLLIGPAFGLYSIYPLRK